MYNQYHFVHEYIDRMIWNYAFLNTGLKLYLNGQEYKSDNGLKDLLEKNITGEIIYPIIHLKGDDIELAMTHSNEHYSEEYYSYVNGQFKQAHEQIKALPKKNKKELLFNVTVGYMEMSKETKEWIIKHTLEVI